MTIHNAYQPHLCPPTQHPTCLGCYVQPNFLQKQEPRPFQLVSLTLDEKDVLSHLAQAWEKFVALPQNSTDNLKEYQESIHRCQQLVALRVARRADPEVWTQPE